MPTSDRTSATACPASHPPSAPNALRADPDAASTSARAKIQWLDPPHACLHPESPCSTTSSQGFRYGPGSDPAGSRHLPVRGRKGSFDLAIGPRGRHLDTIDRPWQNENVIGSKRRVAAIDGKTQLNAPVLRNPRGVRNGAAIGSHRRPRTRYQNGRHLRFEHILPCRLLAKRDRRERPSSPPKRSRTRARRAGVSLLASAHSASSISGISGISTR